MNILENFMREFHLPSGEMKLFWQNGDLPDKNGDIMRYKMGCYWKNQTWQWENGWTKSRFWIEKIIVQGIFQLPVASSLSKLCQLCVKDADYGKVCLHFVGKSWWMECCLPCTPHVVCWQMLSKHGKHLVYRPVDMECFFFPMFFPSFR